MFVLRAARGINRVERTQCSTRGTLAHRKMDSKYRYLQRLYDLQQINQR